MNFLLFLCFSAALFNDVFAFAPSGGLTPNLPASFTQTGFIPVDSPAGSILANNLPPSLPNAFSNNIQVTPIITEIVPSLQYGDITIGGELPITGSIKIRGCFPVYGTVRVDGQVPSAGTAAVPEYLGAQVVDVACQCARQFFS